MFSKKQYLQIPQKVSRTVSFAQATTSAKLHENIVSENEAVNIQSTEVQIYFTPSNKLKKVFEPHQATNGDLSDVEILKKVVHGCHTAFFCAKLKLSIKTLKHSSCESQHTVTLLKQLLIINLSLQIFSNQCFSLKKLLNK